MSIILGIIASGGMAPSPVGCVPTHLDNTIWDGAFGTMIWDGVENRWDRANPPIGAYGILDAIGGWNTSAFRPTTINMTLEVPAQDTETYPQSMIVTVKTNEGTVLLYYADTANYVGELISVNATLDWSGTNGTEYIQEINLIMGSYLIGPSVLCLGFV